MKLSLFLTFLLPLLHHSCGVPTHSKSAPYPSPIISGNVAPFNKIQGTDLYTGVYYNIFMKKFPKGIIAYTDQKTEGDEGHFVQIDQNPNNLPFYKEGEKWYHEVQFAFEPSDVEGFYVLRNRKLFPDIVTHLKDKKTDYRHVIIANEKELVKKLEYGGSLYSSTLMQVIKTDESSGFKYQLKFKEYPQGAITWTSTKYGDNNHYIQISEKTGDAQKYQKGGELYEDTLFSFEPILSKDSTFQGYVSHIDLLDPSPKLLDNYEKHLKIVEERRLVIVNPSESKLVQNVSISYAGLDPEETTGLFKLDDVLPGAFNLRVQFKLPRIKSYTETIKSPTLIGEVNGTDAKLETIVKTKGALLYKEMEIPPKSKVHVTLVNHKLEKVKLPFRAWLVISGEGERLLSTHTSEGGTKRGLLPPQAVYNYLVGTKGVGKEGVRVLGDKVILLVNGVLEGDFNVGWDILA